jgi:hypothetical protein
MLALVWAAAHAFPNPELHAYRDYDMADGGTGVGGNHYGTYDYGTYDDPFVRHPLVRHGTYDDYGTYAERRDDTPERVVLAKEALLCPTLHAAVLTAHERCRAVESVVDDLWDERFQETRSDVLRQAELQMEWATHEVLHEVFQEMDSAMYRRAVSAISLGGEAGGTGAASAVST